MNGGLLISLCLVYATYELVIQVLILRSMGGRLSVMGVSGLRAMGIGAGAGEFPCA